MSITQFSGYTVFWSKFYWSDCWYFKPFWSKYICQTQIAYCRKKLGNDSIIYMKCFFKALFLFFVSFISLAYFSHSVIMVSPWANSFCSFQITHEDWLALQKWGSSWNQIVFPKSSQSYSHENYNAFNQYFFLFHFGIAMLGL